MPLTGNIVEVGGQRLQLGSPSLYAVNGAPSMYARSVYFKDRRDVSSFEDRAQYDLDRRDIKGTAAITYYKHSANSHLPETRVIVIKGARLIAYGLKVTGLSDADSNRLVIEGMGGRRHMGCGLFVPVK